MMLHRQDGQGRGYRAFREGSKGIPMTDRSAVQDSDKWSARVHVADESAAAAKLKVGWHLWMEREDGSSTRPSLITPTSVEGWR